jgi:membrane protease YdiL (CAAX protease family)
MPHNPWALWFLFFFGLFMPYVAIKSAIAARRTKSFPERSNLIARILVMEAIFGLLAAWIAGNTDINLFIRGALPPKALLLAAAIVLVALGTLPLRWRMISDDQKRRLMLTRPREPRDLSWWLAISLAAAIAEELVYRGVMPAVLLPYTRNWWSAIAIVAVIFAVGHVSQGWPGVITVAVIAFGLHILVWLTGALFLGMAVHFVYDFLAGIIYLRLSRELRPEPEAALAA